MDVQAGFLIVKTYPRLYRDYAQRYDLRVPFYALPRVDKQPAESPIQYLGLDRDALDPYDKSDNLAEIRMDELLKEGKCSESGFIVSPDYVLEVRKFVSDPLDYEEVWTRIEGVSQEPPLGYVSVGYEPTYFSGDHFSASCDCMIFPRWHGTDREGTLFLEHFRELNAFGLFASAEAASSFLIYYLSFDWTETGDYEIAEVFVPAAQIAN